MATRAIVTSHPVIACDVCGRRLLRGENPDVFLAGGQRRMVCELCVPRAAYEGWLREADDHDLSVRPSRTRRGGSLLERLRQLREPSDRSARREKRAETGPSSAYSFLEPIDQDDSHERLLDADDEAVISDWEELQAGGRSAMRARQQELEEQAPAAASLHGEQAYDELPEFEVSLESESIVTSGELKVARALEVFNAGEQPRRVAGVARSLGAPSITVRPLDDSGSSVVIVVAWELCWYRYQVDLGDEAAGAQIAGQGMELDELSEQDKLVNATADERGEILLLRG